MGSPRRGILVCVVSSIAIYVRAGKVPRDLARVYNDLFERRQERDYADFVRFQAAQVRPWILQTEVFIAYIKALLSKDDPQAKQSS
jgi:Uncharacterized conserved protein related to C-terminal domain of eukaryotic chaperone, SACSIN